MLTGDKDLLRRDRSALEAALRDAGATLHGRDVRCPFHQDASPSGSIYQGDDGAWRFKCHTAACGFGGDVFDVRARAMNKPVADVLRESSGPAARPKPKPLVDPDERNLRVYPTVEALKAGIAGVEAVYVYTHPDTRRPDLVVLRIREGDDKRFLQARPQGDGFVMLAPPKPWPLYNRARVRAADVVIVVEGEKCVHALTAILPDTIAATTSPAGAKNADKADWSPLAGKQVYLWPDWDESGRAYVRDVRQHLERPTPAPRVYAIDPDGLGLSGPGDDVVEFLALHGGPTVETKRDAVDGVLARARPVGPTERLHALIADTAAGRRAAVGWPWPHLTRLTQALLPGTVTLLCGAGGASKSFWLLQALYAMHRDGCPVALYALEDGREYHLNRLLAQLDGNARLTDVAWVRDNGPAALEAYERHRAALDGFAPRVFAADGHPTLRDLSAWVGARAKDGCRVIAIDPVTAAKVSAQRWLDDQEFVMAVKAEVERHNCSLVLTTHPAKTPAGAKGLSMEALAGGAAYERFAHSVLWLKKPDKPERLTVLGSAGRQAVLSNRTVRLLKTRNGVGQGMDLAFGFSGETLTFREYGVIANDTQYEADEG
jgi:hypothetical protein